MSPTASTSTTSLATWRRASSGGPTSPSIRARCSSVFALSSDRVDSGAMRQAPANVLVALFIWLVVCGLAAGAASAEETRLLRRRAVSRENVAFEYAGDLWVVSRSGGQARRLTATPGVEIDPYFSPDGSQIAFTATVAGNTDVYVVPAAGGDPKRLTYHPGADRVRARTTH